MLVNNGELAIDPAEYCYSVADLDHLWGQLKSLEIAVYKKYDAIKVTDHVLHIERYYDNWDDIDPYFCEDTDALMYLVGVIERLAAGVVENHQVCDCCGYCVGSNAAKYHIAVDIDEEFNIICSAWAYRYEYLFCPNCGERMRPGDHISPNLEVASDC